MTVGNTPLKNLTAHKQYSDMADTPSASNT